MEDHPRTGTEAYEMRQRSMGAKIERDAERAERERELREKKANEEAQRDRKQLVAFLQSLPALIKQAAHEGRTSLTFSEDCDFPDSWIFNDISMWDIEVKKWAKARGYKYKRSYEVWNDADDSAQVIKISW